MKALYFASDILKLHEAVKNVKPCYKMDNYLILLFYYFLLFSVL